MSNSRIFQASYPAERLRGCKFATDFRDPLSVAVDGWAKASFPVIDKGVTTDGADDSLTWTGSIPNVRGISFWVTLASTTEEIITLSATHSVTVMAGVLAATGWAAPTFYVNGVATTAIGTGRSFVTIVTATAFTADTIIVGQVGAAFGAFKLEYLKLWTSSTLLTLAEHTAWYAQTMWNWEDRCTVNLQFRMQDYDPTLVRTLDSSGHGNHFTLGDGVTPTTYPTQGNGRMGFDGGDYLDGGDDADLDFVSAGSLLCCFNLTAYTNYVWLMGKEIYNKGRSGYALYVHNVGAQVLGQVCSAAASQTTALAGPSVQYGMHTAAFAWDGSNIYLFVDGVLLNTKVQVVTPAPSGQRARVGRPSDSASFLLTGTVFDSKWANFAINPTQCADYHHKMMSVIGSQL